MNEMARKLIRPPPLPDMCAEDPHLICNFEPFFHLPIIQFGITETSLTVLVIERKPEISSINYSAANQLNKF